MVFFAAGLAVVVVFLAAGFAAVVFFEAGFAVVFFVVVAIISNWETYCKRLQEKFQRSSEIFQVTGSINSCDIAIGTKIRIAWQPDRVCVIEYLGGNRYVAVKCENSRMKAGDTFTCQTIQKGRELYMDNFTRCGEESAGECYIVGQINGVTTAEIIMD